MRLIGDDSPTRAGIAIDNDDLRSFETTFFPLKETKLNTID